MALILKGKRVIYNVSETCYEKRPDGLHYFVIIVSEGESGYHKTDWDYGTDFKQAQDTIAQLNWERGYDWDQFQHIVTTSMFPGYSGRYPRPETDDRQRQRSDEGPKSFEQWRQMAKAQGFTALSTT